MKAFVRPPRTPSPAQGTAWLSTNSSNGTQIKTAPTVLSPPIRGTAMTGNKPAMIARSQSLSQSIPSIRPTTATILQSAITLGQGNQVFRNLYCVLL